MPTIEIPRNEWRYFLDDFSRKHLGSRVDVEVFGASIGDQFEVSDLPLEGVSTDYKDEENLITISIGDTPEDHISHAIFAPTHVRVKQSDEGGDQVLEIESDDATTLVSFRAPVRAAREVDRQLHP